MDHRVFQFATRGQCIKGKKLDCFEHNHIFCFKLQCASIVVLLCTAIWWKSKDAVVHFSVTRFGKILPLCIIKDLFFNEMDLLTEDINKETSLYMISLIAQLKDN